MHPGLQTRVLPATLGHGVHDLGEGGEPEGADC